MDSLTLEPPSLNMSKEQQQRVMNEEYYRNMATTPQFATGEHISRIDSRSGGVNDTTNPSFLRDREKSFIERELLKQETINQRIDF